MQKPVPLYKLLVFLFLLFTAAHSFAQQTIVKYLSGTDKDHTVQWDFYCTTGQHSGHWSTIAVPSNWEFQGFGTYNYFMDTENPDEQGLYKYKFSISQAWADKKIFIVFEGSMTDTEVKINGESAGPVHQGGFYRFKYDITSLVKTNAENLLEVKVSKKSGNASINKAERRADFWQFGGIYRPVYLEVVPQTYIDRVAVDAKANGTISLDVFAANLKAGEVITAQVQKLNGENVGLPFSAKAIAGAKKITLHQQVSNIDTWNPEFPHLYNLLIAIKYEQATIHQVKQRFGFRTVEFRAEDGFYVNGKRIFLKGVCRHSEWPESGRALSKEISLLDVKLIKQMNMNAVRMSHYPPDQHFLDVCDSLGLFVLDELTGWQNKYDTVIGRKLVKELVVRDVNHPSIVIWDNGNEGGWNTGLDNDFDLYDPQKRHVIHPWENFNGTDNKHYPDYNYIQNSVLYGKEVFFPTEFLHGNYDGGSGTALDDYWDLMMRHPYFAGGFLWSFHDEGAVRTDKDGMMDTGNDQAPDGILGPHREKEGSFYTIKEIWSPVAIKNKYIPPAFNGKLRVENRYIYTNVNQCTFSWQLVKFPLAVDHATGALVISSGKAISPNLAPGETGFLDLHLPANWDQNDALYVKATDSYGNELFTWSWAIKPPAAINLNQVAGLKDTAVIKALADSGSVRITSGNIVYQFDTKSGYLANVTKSGKKISLNNGPALAGIDLSLKNMNTYRQSEKYIVQCNYSGDKGWMNVKWTFAPGSPAHLEYQYSQKGEADFMGITFNYPEEKVTGMKWLGRGPYHVWKNRLKGLELGVWHKDYNNTIAGQTWQYPEFKGYHSELYWVVIENKESPFTVYTDDEHLFLEMLKPSGYSKYIRPQLQPSFPDGNIGFLNGISAMGTKFLQPAQLGPQSQKNMQLNYRPLQGSLWFDFR